MRLDIAFQRPLLLRLLSLFRTMPSERPPTAKQAQMTERIARDIGLSTAERERMNWQPPSERIRHPML